jgi:CRP-like cAMP-binding protein
VTAVEFRNAAWMARSIGRGVLAPLGDADLDDLAAAVGARTFPAGTRVLAEGEVPRVVLVRDGELELTRSYQSKRIALGTAGPGDVVGDISALSGAPLPFDATTTTPSVLAEVDADVLRRFLAERPDAASRVLASLAARVERGQRRLLAVADGDLRHQVAMLLHDQLDGGVGSLKIAQATLAELIGATRPSVNRVLKDLESDGIINLGYRRVDVVDPDRLRSVAGV